MLLRAIIPSFLLLMQSACGWVQLGGGTLNEMPPKGTLIYSGSFSSFSTTSAVSGGVSVYLMSSGSYIVRLESYSGPTETGLQLRVIADSATLTTLSLRSSSGSMNYSVSGTSNADFQQVYVYSPTNRVDYGKADLFKK